MDEMEVNGAEELGSLVGSFAVLVLQVLAASEGSISIISRETGVVEIAASLRPPVAYVWRRSLQCLTTFVITSEIDRHPKAFPG